MQRLRTGYRGNKELWLSLLAASLITAIYAYVVTWSHLDAPGRALFGHLLGVLGFVLMLLTETVYSIRKTRPNATREAMTPWFQFHIFTGLVGPYLVLLHSAWKFHGLAGATLLLTLIIVLSGVIGRYIYGSVTRALEAVATGNSVGQVQGSFSERVPSAICRSGVSSILLLDWRFSWLPSSMLVWSCFTFSRGDNLMKKNSRPGCITTSGIVLAALVALIIAGFVYAKGGLLFNPGNLNAESGPSLRGMTSHAEFANQCSLCHAPFWSTNTMADMCVLCHTDVGVQMLVPSPLHGTLALENPKLTCQDCHTEHHGAGAVLTNMNVVPFPHDVLGYSLASHKTKSDGTPFACADCHPQGDQKFDPATCAACHTQMGATFMQTHIQDFSGNCLACHTGLDPYDKTFDHNAVQYQLTGKHAQVPCGQCHIHASSLAELKSTPQDCNSCHGKQDPHQGRFGSDCSLCHTTTAWLPATFDHNLSDFKLTGKHASLACESCHKNAVYQGHPATAMPAMPRMTRIKGISVRCVATVTPPWTGLRFPSTTTSSFSF